MKTPKCQCARCKLYLRTVNPEDPEFDIFEEDGVTPKATNFETRDYQTALIEIAKKQNIIACLPTGSGKTFIAFKLIEHFRGEIIDGKKAIFLANTIPLVTQQAVFFARNSTLKVKILTGDMEVDYWSEDKWATVIDGFHILSMTTQIFLNIIRHAYIKFSEVALLIFDECHHAVKDHPMKHVMQKYQETKKQEPSYPLPRVFGMTATIIKGNCQPFEVPDVVEELEKTMQAKAVTYKNYESVLKHSTSSRVEKFLIVKGSETNWEHLYFTEQSEDYAKELNKLRKERKKLKMITSINGIDPTLSTADNIFLSLRRATAGDLRMAVDEVRNCCISLGAYCGLIAVNLKLAFIEFSLMDLADGEMLRWYNVIHKFFHKIKHNLENLMSAYPDEEKVTRFTSRKLQQLIGIVKKQFKEEDPPPCPFDDDTGICVIVFVDRRVTAQVLAWYLRDLASLDKDYSFIRANFVVGTSRTAFESVETRIYAKKQGETIEGFRTKKYNLLVATSVLEEGIDVPSCNLIVRFDKIPSYTSYIQSMGRARKPNALFCALIEDKNFLKESLDLDVYVCINKVMVSHLIKNVDKVDEEVGLMEIDHNVEPFCPGGNADSPSVTMESAMDVIEWYCNLLPCDGVSTLQTISWWTEEVGGFRGHLKFPMNSIIRGTVVGEVMSSKTLAKQAVHFTAAKRLYEFGALDDKLLPVRPKMPDKIDAFFKGLTCRTIPDEIEEGEIRDDEPVEKLLKRSKDYTKTSFEGNKEWYRKKIPRVFQSRVLKIDEWYKVYRICLNLTEPKENYFWRKMYDFGKKDTAFGIVSSSEIPDVGKFPLYGGFGVITASLELIPDFKINLTKPRFDGAFEFQNFIFKYILGLENRLIESSKETPYLILPLRFSQDNMKKSWSVDVPAMNDIYAFRGMQGMKRPNEHERRNRARGRQRPDYKTKYENTVVVPWYKGNQKTFYCVETVDESMNPKSKFHDGNHSSYKEFIRSEYKTTIFDDNQPLLKTKLAGVGKGSKQLNYLLEKYSKEDEFPVYLVPELVYSIPIQASSVVQLKLIPSFLHRLYRLLIARDILVDISEKCKWSGILNEIHARPGDTGEDDDINRLTAEQIDKRLADIKRREAFQDRLNKRHKPIPEKQNIENRELHYEFIHPNKITKKDIQLFHEAVSDQHAAKKLVTSKGIDRTMMSEAELTESKIELTAMTEIDLKELNPPMDFDVQGGPSLLAVMEALTVSKSNDGVSNNRFFKIGWSVLNYMISTQTFMRYSDWSEPLMCQLRNRILSIQFLCAIAKRKNLAQVLSSSDFQPTYTWLPPGFQLIYAQCDIGEIAAQHKVPLKVYDLLDLDRIENMSKDELDLFVKVSAPKYVRKRPEVNVTNENQKPLVRKPKGKKQPTTGGIFSSYTHTEIPDMEVASGLCALIGAFFVKCGTSSSLKVLEWLGFPFPDLEGEEHIVHALAFISPEAYGLSSTSDNENLTQLLPFVSELEQKLQYKFGNPKLLLEAMTHPTFLANNISECYQRLEFLGDAILDALLTNHIYSMTIKKDTPDNAKYTTLELGEIKSALVNNITYASLAVRYGFHKHLLSMSKSLLDMVDNFIVYQEACEHHVVGHNTLVSDEEVFGPKHMEVPKVLGDIFEALAGAIYIDSGGSLDKVWKVFYRLMENEIDGFASAVPRSPLQELFAEFPSQVTFLTCTSKKTRARGREMVKITVGPHGSYFGAGTNKTRAKEASGKIALKMIKEEDLFIQDRDASRIMMMC